MKCSFKPDRSMFWVPVVEIQLENADFATAFKAADEAAKSKHEEAIMIAWYDSLKNAFSPAVECCSEEMPGWLVYAKSRGGNFIVSVNHETFIFVFFVPNVS
ncbi:MAG: AF1514 family protein [Thermodesulforhabdaceae bacterium]